MVKENTLSWLNRVREDNAICIDVIEMRAPGYSRCVKHVSENALKTKLEEEQRAQEIYKKIAYLEGKRDGILEYAWFKDGTQWLGSMSHRAKPVIDEIQNKIKELEELEELEELL